MLHRQTCHGLYACLTVRALVGMVFVVGKESGHRGGCDLPPHLRHLLLALTRFPLLHYPLDAQDFAHKISEKFWANFGEILGE